MPTVSPPPFRRLLRRLHNLPIKQQVVLIAFVTTSLALIVALLCLIVLTHQILHRSRR